MARVSFTKMLAELLSVPASVFCFSLKENSNFTESSCKACGSTEEANNCVEVIVTNESTSCTCPSSGTLLGSPKIKKGMFNISVFHFYEAIYGVNSGPLFLNRSPCPWQGGGTKGFLRTLPTQSCLGFSEFFLVRGITKAGAAVPTEGSNCGLCLRFISTLYWQRLWLFLEHGGQRNRVPGGLGRGLH